MQERISRQPFDLDAARLLQRRTPMLMIVLVVVLLLALGGGGWGHSRYGYASWSPAGLILLALVVLWMTGSLHV